MNQHPQLAAVVLAAGRGTRMKSARPKVVHPIAGRPMIQYPLIILERLGADPTILVVGYGADEVKAACDRFAPAFALQEEQKGTGHAVLCALPELGDFEGEVLLLYGDLPLLSAETLESLVRAHRTAGAALSLLTATVADPTGFGRVVRRDGRVVGIVEQRDATPSERAIREVNVGIYCTDAAFLRRALPRLQPNNAQGELYLTDIVALAVAEGAVVGDAAAPEGETAQVNSRAELAMMEYVTRELLNEHWMDAGVTLEDPATTYIDAEVEIGADTVLGANVTLRGKTRVGPGCRFDGNAFVRDADIGAGVHVKYSVVIEGSEIGDGSDVGPFAHLREGTHLAERVSIGNFVETKKARVGARTKARHLSYLGDAEIGSESNIGAGTITCNYDGIRKHRTVIGDRVQIGSDSQLIAPVTVGDDAYVATATTVRKDVPAGALAFTSKTQMNRPGWVAARLAKEAGQLPAGGRQSNERRKLTAKTRPAGPRSKKKAATKAPVRKRPKAAAKKKRR